MERAGGAWRLGLQFRLQPGWKIYWRSPGDAGLPPELDPINFAPRVRVPVLMLNGRYDFGLPYETEQRPLFALLGSAAEHKRHVVLESGHALPSGSVAAEMLPWLDRYLGAVVRAR